MLVKLILFFAIGSNSEWFQGNDGEIFNILLLLYFMSI